ncbi:GNAT family N-acetyltransferase [Alkalihalobacterium bogoriense]|uniref:GNAT family N-acetyltransferase n=1 Tax=Alkalihalobacterium bogoriense TaxID=246272 RepID=UPI0004792397|nr:GNAT family N-acetyltransferase [Alkalihalobacterium bogoriense]
MSEFITFSSAVDTYIESFCKLKEKVIEDIRYANEYVQITFNKEVGGRKHGIMVKTPYLIKENNNLQIFEQPHWIFCFSPKTLITPEWYKKCEQYGYELKFHDILMSLAPIPRYSPNQHVYKVKQTETANVINSFYQREVIDFDNEKIVSSYFYKQENPICYGKGMLVNKMVCIHQVFTHPHYRKRGIAKEVCKTLLQEMNSVDTIGSVLVATEMAVPLYKSLGFKKIGDVHIFDKG